MTKSDVRQAEVPRCPPAAPVAVLRRFRDKFGFFAARTVCVPSIPAPPTSPPDEFRDFFRNNLGYVCESLRRLGVPSADAEDLAHELFMTVYRRFEEYDRTRPPRPWLFAFAVRLASGYRQRARFVRETLGIKGDVPTDAPDAEMLLARDGSRRQVYAALAALPLDRRIVFVMHELDERSVPDIARELEIPVQTAYSRLHAARETFATEIRKRARADHRAASADAPRDVAADLTRGGRHGRA
jgi:RNA polymerase sigma-70 factor, ECF subfamily